MSRRAKGPPEPAQRIWAGVRFPRIDDRITATLGRHLGQPPAAMRTRVVAAIEGTTRYWRKRARRMGQPWLRLVRNLAAGASREELQLVRLVLEWATRPGGGEDPGRGANPDPDDDRGEICAMLDALPALGGAHAIAKQLAIDGHPPGISGLSRMPAAWWCSQRRRPGRLPRIWRSQELEPITREALEKFPLAMRVAVLSFPADRSEIFDAAACAWLATDADLVPGTPECRATWRAAESAVRKGRFDDPALARIARAGLLGAPLVAELVKRMVAAGPNEGARRLARRAGRAMRGALTAAEADAVRLALSDPARRAARLTAMEPKRRRAVLPLLPWRLLHKAMAAGETNAAALLEILLSGDVHRSAAAKFAVAPANSLGLLRLGAVSLKRVGLARGAALARRAAADPQVLEWVLAAVPELPLLRPAVFGAPDVFVRVCAFLAARPRIRAWPFLEGAGWKRHLEAAIAAGAAPAESLIALMRGVPREERLLVVARYPEVLIPPLADDLTMSEVIHLATTSVRAGGVIDRVVPRETLRSWIRGAVRAARNRYDAAAFEIGLAFSVQDIPYLRALASERFVRARRDGGDPLRFRELRGRLFDGKYRTYALPKKSGGSRTITVPEDALKRLQGRLLRNGFEEVPVAAPAHGFVKGRSILTNASPHCGKALVVNVDIASCFPSTPYREIVGACRKLMGGGLSRRAVMLVADLCSYGGGLPTGAPTSPYVVNLILRPIDRALERACARVGVAYTRYADDLTFSGGDAAKRMIPFARRLLRGVGYELAEKKVNLFRRGRRQIVTGLVVNDRPNIPRRIRRRIRAAVHQAALGHEPRWHGRPMERQALRGHVALLEMLAPEEASRLFARLGERRPA